MDAPSLQLPLGALFFAHFFHHNIRFFRHDNNLCEGFAGPENMGCPFRRDLNTIKNIIGHQLRSNAGTAIGTVLVESA